jgi:biotin operon repressor
MANLAAPVGSGRIQLIGRYSPTPGNTSFIPTSIIGNNKIGPGPKRVYSRLLSYAAANEAATNNRLAADLAVSPRSVRKYIAALKAAGFVEVQHHPGKPRSFKLALSAGLNLT